jgi:thioredoxin-related protein
MYEFFIIKAKGCGGCMNFMINHEQNVRTLLTQHFPDIMLKILEKPDLGTPNWGDIPEYVSSHVRYFPQFFIFKNKQLLSGDIPAFEIQQNIEKIRGFVTESKPTNPTTPTTQNENKKRDFDYKKYKEDYFFNNNNSIIIDDKQWLR